MSIKSIKLLLITGSFPPMHCGVGAYAFRLAAALAERGDIDVTVLTGAKSLGTVAPGIRVAADIDEWKLCEIGTLVRRVRDADLVHAQYPAKGYGRGWLPFVVPGVCRVFRKPCVQTWHEPRLGRALELLLSTGSGTIITPRRDLHALMSPHLRRLVPPERISYLANASLLPPARLDTIDRQSFRRRFACDNSPLLVFFGHIAPLKGCETLIKLACENPEYTILVCGAIDEGNPYHQGLRRAARTAGVAANLRFLGHLDDHELARLVAVADAAVFPFAKGAGDWNTSIQAARAEGTLVVTTSTSCEGYFESEHTAYTRVTDTLAMSDAIRKFSGLRLKTADTREAWIATAEAHKSIYDQMLRR